MATAQDTSLLYAEVIVESNVAKPLTYSFDPSTCQPKIGCLVEVLLRGKKKKGVVIQVHDTPPEFKTQPIVALLDSFSLSQPLLKLAIWMSQYYCCSLTKVLLLFIPQAIRLDKSRKSHLFVKPLLTYAKLKQHTQTLRAKFPSQALVLDFFLKEKEGLFLQDLLKKLPVSRSPIDALAKKEILKIESKQLFRSPLSDVPVFPSQNKRLSSDQKKAFEAIKNDLENKVFKTHLIFGITGSGKTEIYLQLMQEALKKGLGVIFLVPEISLTFQTIQRVKSRLNVPIGVIHSQLSDGEKQDILDEIHQKKISVVIGARSALFAPIDHLQLIIVDEEHDSSYKQNEKAPSYHARDVAIMRGHFEQAVVVLGSATPSLESYYNAQKGKYTLHHIPHRVENTCLPEVEIVDMKQACDKAGRYTFLSDLLLKKIKDRFEKGEQTLLFLNRRGYHTTIVCKSCLQPCKCTRCDVTLTYHKQDDLCACHLCDYTVQHPKTCAYCNEPYLQYKGYGTEQVQRTLQAIFPEIRTVRVDKDTTTQKGSQEKLLNAFRTLKADVLIGTQMITKGLHFPQVTLVGILSPDRGLLIPDFRASELLFSQLVQTSGRAGRGESLGEVVIQTYLSDHTLFKQAADQDYLNFYAQEMCSRKTFGFPPYTKLIKLQFTGKEASTVASYAKKLRELLIQLLDAHFTIMPVIENGCSKINEQFRFQFLIKGPAILTASEKIKTLLLQNPPPSSVRCFVDVDPTSTFF